MTPPKWHTTRPTARRSTRRTINIPPGTVVISHASNPAPKPTFEARIWAVAKIAGPSVVAVAALVISILALQDQLAATRGQLQADQADIVARQEQQADQVSVVQGPNNVITIANASDNAIQDVSILIGFFGVIPAEAPDSGAGVSVNLQVSDIPACKDATAHMTRTITGVLRSMHTRAGLLKAEVQNAEVYDIGFADYNDVGWTEGPGIPLHRDPEGSVSFIGQYLPTKFTPAIGCQ